MKIAILGSNGMLGSCMLNKFRKTKLNVDGFVRPQFDAERPDFSLLKNYDYIINCIGIIKPYIHDNNSNEVLRATRVNAEFPHLLSHLDSKIIQIATDCVWDGKHGNYVESDPHNATDVYGKTKSIGEVHADNFLNLRCSIIGREEKNFYSLLEWFLHQPQNAKLNGFRNHLWNGLTTDAFADICIGIITNDLWFSGMQHMIPSDIVTKAQMLHIFAEHFNRPDISITDTDATIPINRALGTQNTQRNMTLWHAAGYSNIPNVKQMITEIDNDISR